MGQQGARQGPAEGRGAQLRHQKAAPQIRRRDERPAQGGLRAAPRDHERARCRRHRQRYARRDGRRDCGADDPGEFARRAVGHRGAARRMPAASRLELPFADWAKEEGIGRDEISERISAAADRKMAEKSANYGPDLMRMAEKSLLLQLLDQTW